MVFAQSAAAQPMDLRVVRDPAVEDYDFSWVYWFESHGQAYVRAAVQERKLPWDTPASRRWRDQAVTALVNLMDDEADRVRAAAIIALGRIGHEPVLDRVLPEEQPVVPLKQDQQPRACLLLDASSDVRLAAWITLGLIDSDRSRAALALAPMQESEEIDLVAQAAAIGLLDSPGQIHLRWLVSRLEDPAVSLEVKRWCIWAMTQHDQPAMDEVFDAALRNLPSTFIISQVLLNAQYAERKGAAGWLVDVLRYHPQVRDWAGYRALSALPVAGAFGSTPRRLAEETRIAATLALARQPIPPDPADQREVLEHLRLRITSGNSAMAMDFNRGFDMISYVMLCHADGPDLDLLYDQMRGITQVPPDDPAVKERVKEGQALTTKDFIFTQVDNESRSYAALAAGLLIRRATQGTELQQQRPILGREAIDLERLRRRFGIRLMRAVANVREPVSYRAACALALGLTGDEQYTHELSVELGKLRAGDEAVLGYGLLALAMLGDERAASPAQRYLTRPGGVERVEDRLGRRAALLAVGVIGQAGGDDTDAALKAAWGKDLRISLDAALATAMAGRYPALPGIIEAAGSENAAWRQAAADSLGLIFDRAHPARINALVAGLNPTLSHRPDAPAERTARPNPDAPEPDAGPLGWPIRRVQMLINPMDYEIYWP